LPSVNAQGPSMVSHHAARRLRHVAIATGDDRMHIPLGQAARHHAKHRGIASVAADFLLNLIAYNLICIPQLVAAWVSGRAEHQKQLPKASAARTDHQKREQWLNF
jgi:hypothetical protein